MQASDLPDFLAAISKAAEPDAARRAGVARIAEAFDAEVAAVVCTHEVLASVGYPRGAVDVEGLLSVADGRSDSIAIPGMGPTEASLIPFADVGCALVVGRWGESLDTSELAHAQAMARILALGLQLLDSAGRERDLRLLTEQQFDENRLLLDQHRTQSQILEAVLRVQRLISQRRPVDSILQAITGEAARLLRADLAGICVFGPDGATSHAISAESEVGRTLAKAMSDREVVSVSREAAEGTLATPRTFALRSPAGDVIDAVAVGAPVYDDGQPIGGLYLVTADQAEPGDIESPTVQTFASQASIALTDASTVKELHDAFHDPLTGLPNRALFQDRFEHAIQLGVRRQSTTALLFLDLDHFKAVNDTLGHAAGDRLLRDVGAALAGASRAQDTVARLGGDEFAVLMEDTDVAAAEGLAERLRKLVAGVACPTGASGSCSASIGIAYTEADCKTTDELLRRADIAMYAVKARARGGIATYETAMGRTRLDQNAVAASLQAALGRDEFVVHYQPIHCLQTREIYGVEALVRWENPTRGLVGPADIIDAAEETGMIVPIGRRVLELSCAQVAEWRRTIPAASELTVAVNLSGGQLQDDQVREDIVAALDNSGLDPSALTLEVTESVFVNDAEAAGDRLRALKDLGVSLAVDDFGTGFSSLSYIHHYPFDVLKIDRSFVRGLGTGANGGAVVRTMLALAQQLGMSVIAEGIETPVELAQLRALRCSHGQGFLFSPPLDTESTSSLLKQAGPRRLSSVS